MSVGNARRRRSGTLRLSGVPNERQREFFAKREKYVAYGGARGGGKSWALRRKLILMALRYPGLRALIIRRSYPELRENHILPLQRELADFAEYSESAKRFELPNGSRIMLGFCSAERDVLRYQGQEYDVIAIDEATQLTEYQFDTLRGSLRGANRFPKRMYLTCNPGGVGHAWVKRLFVDREFRPGERPEDYAFVPARIYDNRVLMELDPDYVGQLESLSPSLRAAWLEGSWDIFEGQFFPEFSAERHVIAPIPLDDCVCSFGALDYGFDMTAFLTISVEADSGGRIIVTSERCESGLTLSQAAQLIASAAPQRLEYIVASPDLWNRRQDSGYSGVEILNRTCELPPLIRADDRRIPGWRCVREYLAADAEHPLAIFSSCRELIRCMGALRFDRLRPEDAAGEPHSVTHAPEALRYGLMSRTEIASELPERSLSGYNSIANY